MQIFEWSLVFFVSLALTWIIVCACIYAVVRATLSTLREIFKLTCEYQDEKRKVELRFS